MAEKTVTKALAAAGLLVVLLLGVFVYLSRPDSDLTPPLDSGELHPGLVASYRDAAHRITEVVPTPNFYLGGGESLHPSLSPNFEAQWSGLISILQTDEYRFSAAGAQIYVDGKEIGSEAIPLETGRYPIRIAYARRPGTAQLQFQWESGHFSLEPVPSSALQYSTIRAVSRQDSLAEEGRYLVQELGCVNCHASRSSSLQGRVGPDLTGIGSRTNPAWLHNWLEDPSAFRSGAVMPAMLDDQQRRDVVAYLASLGSGTRGKQQKANPVRALEGKQLYASLGCAACHNQQGLSLEGLGSKTSLAVLAGYLKDPFRRDSSGRMPSLLLADEEAVSLASFLVQSRNPAFESPVQQGDPQRGKELVQSEGCLGCHSLSSSANLVNRHQARALEELGEGGCLAGQPARGLPHYRLSGQQREALQIFLRLYREHPDVSPAPLHEFYETIRKLRCTACHEIRHLGPAVRLPELAPPLSEAGAKLRTRWVEKVLTGKERVRAWLELRMPHYDPRHVEPLIELFAKAAGVKPGEGPPGPLSTNDREKDGVDMIGADAGKGGLACIRCHDWEKHEALGDRGPQLKNVAERVRFDWFYRFLLDPGRVYSGTSMPDHFTARSRREADQAIASLWAAFSMGDNMPLPEGLVPDEAALGADARPVPRNEPIVIRCYMPDATPAAIAVGLPGGLSYCFDAGRCQLRYAWQGGFIDWAEQLQRKAGPDGYTPTAEIIGEIFYRSHQTELRVDEPDRVPPTDFRGYRLVEGHPEFHYRVESVDVRERIVSAAEGRGIRRIFQIEEVNRPMWFVIPEEPASRATSSLGRVRQGRLEIPRGRNVAFEITVRSRETQR